MTKFVGVLNITDDSFSDGMKTIDYDEALQRFELMLNNNVDVIDVGAESTRPGATSLTFQQEIARLKPILPILIKTAHQYKVKISLDSYHHQTFNWAVDQGIDIINDVSGAESQHIIDIVSFNKHLEYIFMHNLGLPVDKTKIIDLNINPLQLLKNFFYERCEVLINNGVNTNQIIADPGIGFGKNAPQSIQIIRNITQLKSNNYRLMVGHSRKSMFNNFTKFSFKERDIETLATSSWLVKNKIDFLRVHNTEYHHRFFSILKLFDHNV
jgi:dihydropteroate synthase